MEEALLLRHSGNEAPMNGIEVLLNELKRKAELVCNYYHRGVDVARDDWPRDAEIELIEALVIEKAKKVTGQDSVPETLWNRCRDFARAIQRSRFRIGLGKHRWDPSY